MIRGVWVLDRLMVTATAHHAAARGLNNIANPEGRADCCRVLTVRRKRMIHLGIALATRWRRRRDSNPRYDYSYGSLAGNWFQPLTHVSGYTPWRARAYNRHNGPHQATREMICNVLASRVHVARILPHLP